MDFETFQRKVVEAVTDNAGSRKAELREIWKNNGRKGAGLTISGPKDRIFPVVYLEDHYKKLQAGQSFEAVLQGIRQEYERHRPSEGLDLSMFTRWEWVRENLCMEVVNYRENQKLLAQMPHQRFLDLAAVYCYRAGLDEDHIGTVRINRGHMQMLRITEEELKEWAWKSHRKRSRVGIRSLDQIILEAAGQFPGRLWEKEGAWENPVQMYVVSDLGSPCGASVLLFPERFRELAGHCGSDLYLLPSSIYEVLALPVVEGRPESPKELAQVVREINQTQVPPQDRLSDSVYHYDRESGEITLAWEGAGKGPERTETER